MPAKITPAARVEAYFKDPDLTIEDAYAMLDRARLIVDIRFPRETPKRGRPKSDAPKLPLVVSGD